MKCTNKYKILLPVLILALLLLTGCTQRSDVAEAYQLYETSDNYALTESSASAAPELLAENLCVGGTENSATDGIDAAFAQSAGVFSVEDEVVTYAQNIYQRMYPASTTKILTAYIALKYGNLDDVITVSNEAITSLMSGSSICGLKPGDSLALFGSVIFAIQMLFAGHFSPKLNGLKLSCSQFLVASVLNFILMLIWETPNISSILSAVVPLFYTGLLSSAVGYTLQIIAQKDSPPAVAALILSLESVFSVIGAWLILHQTMSLRETFGCLFMFAAIILAQLPGRARKSA